MPSTRVGNMEMAYADRGAGPPVLLVHGFPLDHTMWDPIAGQLEDICRLIAPDLRGYGQSTLGEIDPAEGVSMRRYADDLAGLLDAVGVDEPVVYVGFSMGGYIGWQFLEHHGDRVRALVLCDTRAAADSEEGRTTRLKMASHVAEWGAERVAEAMLPKLFAEASFDEHPETVERVRSVIASTDPRAIAAAQLGMAARPDVTAALGGVRVPAALVVGEQDRLSSPDEMRAIAGAMPDAELTVVPNAGHMAPVEDPAVVAGAMRRLLSRLP